MQVELSSFLTEWGLPQFTQHLKCNLIKKKFNLTIPCLEVEVVLYLYVNKVMYVCPTLHTHIYKMSWRLLSKRFTYFFQLVCLNWSDLLLDNKCPLTPSYVCHKQKITVEFMWDISFCKSVELRCGWIIILITKNMRYK